MVQSLIVAKRKFGLGITEWSDPLTDELHKPVRKHFKKRKVFTSNVYEILAADLVDMQYSAKAHKGYCYILMIIDIFSNYGYAIPLKSERASGMVEAFKGL